MAVFNGDSIRLMRAGQVLLDNVSLRLQAQSAITALVGANGSGKSSLVSVLAGLTVPDTGEVRVNGKPPLVRQIGLMTQKPVIMRRSVAGNFAYVFAGTNLAPHVRQARIHAMLLSLDLAHKASQPATTLSVGEAQRMALGRCLLQQPAVLLADEATSSLDPASMLLIEKIVLDEAARGLPVLWVSHNLAQVQRMASRVYFMHGGRLAPAQATSDFFAKPASIEAARFIMREKT